MLYACSKCKTITAEHKSLKVTLKTVYTEKATYRLCHDCALEQFPNFSQIISWIAE